MIGLYGKLKLEIQVTDMKEKIIFALGFFDGVHLGHAQLLWQCKRLAGQVGAKTGAITFEKHPKSLFLSQPPVLINSIEDRMELLRENAMEQICVLPVTRESMTQPWQEFLRMLLQKGAVGFVCGDDFRFGHKGEGNPQKLGDFCREQGMPLVVVPEQTLEGVRISSTHIRGLIESGDVETAAKFLGHPHILSGDVVHGRHLGRTIGIPTANVLIPEGVVVPRLGVYACTCDLEGKTYVTVTNIGSRPTVGGHQVRAESWILDFDGDLYDARITLRFHKFLRPEIKFDSLEALQKQIQHDAAAAFRLLK